MKKILIFLAIIIIVGCKSKHTGIILSEKYEKYLDSLEFEEWCSNLDDETKWKSLNRETFSKTFERDGTFALCYFLSLDSIINDTLSFDKNKEEYVRYALLKVKIPDGRFYTKKAFRFSTNSSCFNPSNNDSLTLQRLNDVEMTAEYLYLKILPSEIEDIQDVIKKKECVLLYNIDYSWFYDDITPNALIAYSYYRQGQYDLSKLYSTEDLCKFCDSIRKYHPELIGRGRRLNKVK
ncbi:MAG: hypothetical protein LBL74_05180 [Bacteroidales bacterium]|jgi:hypothetical protein|nr:hypothetical protein [Bacteroidales bacterium]